MLIAQAQDEGAVRAGSGGDGRAAPDAWRRFAALMVDAFRAAGGPLPSPPDDQQLRRSVALLTGSG